MITANQVREFAKKYKTNELTIYREYIQLLFLSKLYNNILSKKIVFKGGTALHLIYGTTRFSEDLDFTAEITQNEIESVLKNINNELKLEGDFSIKERKTLSGKRYLLTSKTLLLPSPAFINLDFSLREKPLTIYKSTITTIYPIIFSSFVYAMTREEICAEKIRTIVTRNKGRDLYDLWYLLSHNIRIDQEMVKQKLDYYHISYEREFVLNKIKNFSKKDYFLDMNPFLPINERAKISEQFDYIKTALERYFS